MKEDQVFGGEEAKIDLVAAFTMRLGRLPLCTPLETMSFKSGNCVSFTFVSLVMSRWLGIQ